MPHSVAHTCENAYQKKLAKLLNIQSVPAVFFEGKQIKAPQSVAGWETKLNLNK